MTSVKLGEHKWRDGSCERREEQPGSVNLCVVTLTGLPYASDFGAGPRGTTKMLVDGAGSIKLTKASFFESLT